MLGEHVGVDLQGFLVFADVREHHGPQVAITGVARFAGHQQVHLLQSSNRAVLPIQCHGVVIASRIEARRELQAAHQEIFRVLIASQTARHLREHPDGRDIRRMTLQVLSQQHFRMANLVFAQRVGCRHETRVLGRCLDMLRVGRIGAVGVALKNQQIADFSPRVR